MQTRKPFLHLLFIVLAVSFSPSALRADRIVLKSGDALEGEIISENAYEVKVEVSRNQDGTIRTIKVIDQKLVESMSRGQPVRNVTDQISATPEPAAPEEEPEPDILDLSRIDAVLQQSDGLLSAGEYDEAIKRYQAVASNPKLIELHTQNTRQSVEALELRAKAYRLWIVAVEGKIEHSEELRDRLEEEVTMEFREAEEAIADQRKAERDDDRNNKKNYTGFRSRGRAERFMEQFGGSPQSEVEKNFERAKVQLDKFKEWEQRNALEMKNLESEAEHLEEKEDQIKDELSDIKRDRRRR